MAASALILTYHAVDAGPAPLCLDPELFEEHLDRLRAARVTALTVAELAALLRAGRLPERAVAITFDDGFGSVATAAAPAMAERGLRGTVFCVSEHVGKENDWPTQSPRAPRRRLASADDLRDLAAAGFEIGCHTATHVPLDAEDRGLLERELVASKASLEDTVGAAVSSIAYPYGARRSQAARELVRRVYSAGCTAAIGFVGPAADSLELPRVDAHYLRRPRLVERAARGSVRPYLRLRGAGAAMRRRFLSDYAPARAA